MPPYTGGMSFLKPSRTAHHPSAALTVPVCLSQEGAAGLPAGLNVQLFPEGTFAARDGRPATMTGGALAAWRMNADIAAAIVAAVASRETPLVIDYEHQSLNARQNGQPAPAAGWVESVAFVPGRGLFAAVSWTERARAYIEAGEYRFISPVFTFDATTGAVQALASAALTNTPALDGMEAVAAVEDPTTQETAMDELLERLRWMLNLPVTATAGEVIAQLDKLKGMLAPGAEGEATATAAPVDLVALLTEQREQIATLTTQATTPDPARFAPVAALTALQQSNTALQSRVAELEAGHELAALTAEIDAALADGRLNKAVEPWARELAKTDAAALRTYLAAAVPVAALTHMQTGGVIPAGAQPGTAALTEEARYVINQLGITPEEYRAANGEEA